VVRSNTIAFQFSKIVSLFQVINSGNSVSDWLNLTFVGMIIFNINKFMLVFATIIIEGYLFSPITRKEDNLFVN